VHLLLVQEVSLHHSSWNKQCKTCKVIIKLQYIRDIEWHSGCFNTKLNVYQFRHLMLSYISWTSSLLQKRIWWMLFSGMTPYSLIETYWHFGGRSSSFLRNGGQFVLYYKLTHPRKEYFSFTALRTLSTSWRTLLSASFTYPEHPSIF
jgi:hypothetical protein